MKLDINGKNFIKKLNKIIHKKNVINGKADTSYVDDELEFSVDDIYYIMKFYGFNSERDQKMLKNMFGEETLNKLDEEYDNRILTIPKQVCFYPIALYESKPIIKSLDGLYINENTKAIYVENLPQLFSIFRVLVREDTVLKDEHRINNIKYLLLSEKLYNSGMGDTISQKKILVPNDAKYSELKNILNEELIKDNELNDEYKIR